MNQTGRESNSPLRLQLDVAIPFVSVLTIIGLTSLTINLLIVVAISKYWKTKKGYELFVLQSTLIDLIATVITIPFWILTVIQDERFGNDILCQLNGSMCLMELIAPVLFLMLATAYRHSGLVGHEAYERVFTEKRSYFFILLGWLLSILLCLPQNFGWKPMPEVSCIPDLVTNIWYTMYMLTFFFFLPLAASLFAHLFDIVLFKPERYQQKSSTLFQICKRKCLRGEELEIQKSMCLVIVAHACSWLPYVLISITENLAGSRTFYLSGVSLHFISLTAGLSGMSVKGALFCFENPRIRRRAKELFGCIEENEETSSHQVDI
ncbi:rhodopsin, GQ-coupled-like [Actinia tenebrosa]|uniref:Rhodopsin, GQ-coupled-like n=1 Tax=Actinia tenebrosa TaxID=6105 RepID=A0A6P8HBH2_ACTTE|nr:rhodopsin, GQ-coupled-like [Actinia tenebrosa]